MERSTASAEPASGADIVDLRDEADGMTDDAILADWGHDAHRHSFGQFISAIVGSGSISIDGRSFGFDATSGVWVPAGVVHSARFVGDCVPIAVDLPTQPPVSGPQAISIGRAVRSALLSFGRDDHPERSAARRRVITAAIDGAPVVRPGLRIPTGELTAPVMEHLRRYPSHVRSLAEWSGILHASAATVRRAFLAETGMPYSEWCTLFRLDQSIERLLRGESVAQVARASGFSPNGYGLAFRRWTGLTPSEFRSRNSE